MGTPPNIKRLAKEDFSAEDRELIGKLAFPLNSFMEQVRNLLDGNIDFQNLKQELVTVDVTAVSGFPTVLTKFKSNLSGKILGMHCVMATNLTDGTNYPTSAPFISFTQDSGIVTIQNVSGLQDSETYQLKLVLYGN